MPWLSAGLLSCLLAFGAFVPDAHSNGFGGNGKFCSTTARVMSTACGKDAEDDLQVSLAICINISDRFDRRDCYREAFFDLQDARAECRDQREARLDVCGLLGEARYEPDFDPANFVDPSEIGNSVEPNPYLPLVVGNTWVYEGGDEVVTVVVTDRTKLIEGVTCRVVNDVVTDEGAVIEDTDDWFAQDLDGNVHYCGEEVQDFETFEGDDPEDPELVSIDGAFKVGRDGAKSGFLVLAFPQVGDAYRQEFALGEAEDVVEVISITGSANVPAASCDGTCLVTRDFSPLDPGPEENKYYAPGVGPILEVDLETGERLELVEFTTP